jgi:hypothetical protein
MMLMSACSNKLTLEVESDVPTPLATKLPLSVGVYYSDNFKNFMFEEDSENRENWVIDNRASRISLFNDILPTMFSSVNPLDSLQNVDSSIDLILEPQVMEMQVALPDETHSDMYEAWIKYVIKMYHTNGDLIVQLPITGYGKTPTAIFKNKERGLSTAISMALRDIGAKLVLDVPKSPEVRNWLLTKIDCTQYSYLCS